MEFNNGYILLPRSLVESVVFKNEKWLKVYIWCYMEANFKDNFIPVNTGRGTTAIKVERGQFIFGRNKHAKELGMPPSTLWKIILKLKLLEVLDVNSDTHYSLITVCDYNVSQDFTNYKVTTKEQPRNNQGTQHKESNKRKNNIYNPLKNKKDFLDNIPDSIKIKNPNLTSTDYDYFTDSIIDYCESTGKKYKDYFAALRTFIKNEKNYAPKPQNGGHNNPLTI